MRSLVARLRGEPRLVRQLNEWLVIAWLVFIPVVLVTGWYDSLPLVTALSIWANLAAHWAAATAARADEENRKN